MIRIFSVHSGKKRRLIPDRDEISNITGIVIAINFNVTLGNPPDDRKSSFGQEIVDVLELVSIGPGVLIPDLEEDCLHMFKNADRPLQHKQLKPFDIDFYEGYRSSRNEFIQAPLGDRDAIPGETLFRSSLGESDSCISPYALPIASWYNST